MRRRWPILVLVALPLVFTAPAVFTGRSYAPLDLLYTSEPFASYAQVAVRNSVLTDVSHQIVPWNLAVRHAIRSGDWPLWNPLMLSGDVLAAAAQPAPYWPVNVVSWLLPLPHALTFIAVATFFLAGLGAWLFFRRLGLSELASITGAAAWMYATPVVFYVQWPLGASIALLPLVLYGVEFLLAEPRRGTIALTIALTLLILAGHPESVVHIVFAGVVYALVRMPKPPLRVLAAALLAGAIALGLTAVYLLPIQDALPQTVQYDLRRAVMKTMDRSLPLAESAAMAVRSFVPFVYGRLVHDVADDKSHHYWLAENGYAGSVVLALALFGLWRSKHRVRWLFFGMTLLGLLAGSSAPGIADVLKYLPLFDIALNERLIVLCAFGLVALAALGVDALGEGGLAAVCATLIVVLGIAVLLLWPSMRAGNLSPALLATNTLFLLLPLALLPFLRTKPAFIVALLLAQRYLEMGDFWPSVDAKLATPDLALVRQLPRDGEPYRVVGLGQVLLPNSSAYFGLEDVRGYQAMNLRVFHDTYKLWCDAPPVGANLVNDLTKPFLSMMNVRYAFTLRDAPLPPGWRRVGAEGGYAIAENTRVLPRAFVPRTIHCGFDDVDAMARATDFAAESWLRGDCETTPLANPPGTARTTRRGAGHLAIDVKADGPAWVVVSESAWRGWKVFDARGNAVPLRRANHAFLAFRATTGRYELVYRPRAFVLGAWLSAWTSAITLFALILIRIARWRASARSRSSSSSSPVDRRIPPPPAAPSS